MSLFLKAWKKYSFILLFVFLVAGLIDKRFALAAILCMTAPVIISFSKGRFWCGNLCPRGSFYDSVLSKISAHKRVPAVLKSWYFRTAVFLFMMSMFTIGIRKNWGNAAGTGSVFYRMIVITTFAGILLSFLYNQRTWCHFCPMGTLAALISSLQKKRHVLRVSNECISCKLCEKKCAFSLRPYTYKGTALNAADCIQCGKCAEICPKKAIGY